MKILSLLDQIQTINKLNQYFCIIQISKKLALFWPQLTQHIFFQMESGHML